MSLESGIPAVFVREQVKTYGTVSGCEKATIFGGKWRTEIKGPLGPLFALNLGEQIQKGMSSSGKSSGLTSDDRPSTRTQ
jgi:hypothetical protein